MKIKFYYFICLWMIAMSGFAQQIPFYTQYMLNPYIYNPAYAGTIYHYQLNASYRYQWVDVKDAPSSVYLSGHGHVGKDHPFQRRRHKNQNDWHNGIGFIISSDNMGPIIKRNNISVSYAYDTPLSRTIRVSFGLSAGIRQFVVDGTKAETRDASVPVSSFSALLPDMNAGFWLYHDLWFLGASAQQIFVNKIDKTVFPEPTGTNRLFQHYFITAGAVVNLLPDPRIDIVPSGVLKQVEGFSRPSFDLNLKLKYKQLPWKDKHGFWGGITYRNQQGISFMIGGKVADRYEFGYAYDYTLSYLNGVSKGSHELFLGYKIYPKIRVQSPSDYW